MQSIYVQYFTSAYLHCVHAHHRPASSESMRIWRAQRGELIPHTHTHTHSLPTTHRTCYVRRIACTENYGFVLGPRRILYRYTNIHTHTSHTRTHERARLSAMWRPGAWAQVCTKRFWANITTIFTRIRWPAKTKCCN